MTASYRLVHFAPEPFSGFRLPMAAVVRLASGEVRVARARDLPTQCLPAGRARMLSRMLLHLDTIDTDAALPAPFGPYAVLDEPRLVPRGVQNAVAWVESLLNPDRGPAQTVTRRSERRSTQGYRFFETYGVARHVHRSFEPRRDLGGLFGGLAGLKTVSHWAGTSDKLLLMEPVVVTRHQFEKDLHQIASAFLGYRYAMEHAERPIDVSLITYVTATDDLERVAATRERLGTVADRVIDTNDKQQRERFLGQIRAAAQAPELDLDG